MNEIHSTVLQQFPLKGSPVSCERYGCGHINVTYLVVTDTKEQYILQQINHHIFKNVDELMENIVAVTDHLKKKNPDPRAVLQVIRTNDGASYFHHEADDTYWRVYWYVSNSVCLQAAESLEDFRQSAVAFGEFQEQLQDFPAATLHESIPNFHNTVDRYRIFRETLKADPMGRAKDVQKEIQFVLDREKEAGTIVNLLKSGELPLRVTHNDTKLNNVMLDADTHKALCVIDLDTVMPGSSLYDYGDSIRFGAASAPEDEKDLNKMEMRLDLFETYTKAFMKACPGLTPLERELLPMGAKLMTLECGVRFLTDYLDGDHYFAVHREGHNLDRARTQFKLVADMEAKWTEMQNIVKEG